VAEQGKEVLEAGAFVQRAATPHGGTCSAQLTARAACSGRSEDAPEVT